MWPGLETTFDVWRDSFFFLKLTDPLADLCSDDVCCLKMEPNTMFFVVDAVGCLDFTGSDAGFIRGETCLGLREECGGFVFFGSGFLLISLNRYLEFSC